ncbi:hypothetical protein CEUSTIGMA_g7206.t1 [Chlamydomonas eustigma]|uniref:Uncharacterized protein n=1 Tax=Chlamydomonas eustigma TaxID=1157962 RepID=A0A250X9I8_9CHLO|nr:hypothetical protein CEUSTIGMA_g7206.t1 [Chlamydomonas eustigma]|eukprot:GAX79765.1 hypothetical protein CEUSTIGMA_g7206.t1 [Chlamydomonas eustigma]
MTFGRKRKSVSESEPNEAISISKQQVSVKKQQIATHDVKDDVIDIEKEIAMQESEVDLTAADIAQLQYEMPEEDEDEDEGDGPESGASASSATSHQGFEAPELGPVDQRIQILVELLSAGGNLDAKIAQFREDIDLEMLQLLEQRLETAKSYEEGSPAVQHLEDMYRILKVVYQRNSASPAMRLLDDVLDILGDTSSISGADNPFAPTSLPSSSSWSGDDQEGPSLASIFIQRRKEVAARMRSAFSGGMPEGVDIFAAAVALGETGPIAAEELSVEYVRLHEFLAETTELLDQAKKQQTELREAIERTQRELEYVHKRQPSSLSSDTRVMEMVKNLQLAQVAFNEREQSMAQLDEIIYIARTVEVQTTRDLGGGALGF